MYCPAGRSSFQEPEIPNPAVTSPCKPSQVVQRKHAEAITAALIDPAFPHAKLDRAQEDKALITHQTSNDPALPAMSLESFSKAAEGKESASNSPQKPQKGAEEAAETEEIHESRQESNILQGRDCGREPQTPSIPALEIPSK